MIQRWARSQGREEPARRRGRGERAASQSGRVTTCSRVMVISTEAERRAFMPVQAESCSVNGRVVVVVAGAATTELVKTTAGQVQERQRGKVSKEESERGALAKQSGHRPESVSYSAAEQCCTLWGWESSSSDLLIVSSTVKEEPSRR